MTTRESYLDFMQRREEAESNPMFKKFWTNQERRYVKPFHIFGNVWYVGDSWVCVHLIETSAGLLLIDAGNIGAAPMLVHAIWSLGFRPDDVKWIILSHGHVDHFGAANFFKRMFGTQIYIGEPDAVTKEQQPELIYLQDAHNLGEDLYPVDHVICDGDTLHFGDLTIQCRLVPGHTKGCVALFFPVTENERTVRAGYYGGFGFNTLTKAYLREIGDTTYSMRQIYLQSLRSVMDEPVDLFLGNHTDNNHVLEKREKIIAGCGENPFLNSSEWKMFLQAKEQEMLAYIADPANN